MAMARAATGSEARLIHYERPADTVSKPHNPRSPILDVIGASPMERGLSSSPELPEPPGQPAALLAWRQ